ncbi:unnamed protein product [Colias eurytheme]|nr:unnamed protein product [Colias eurytheme]
MFTYSRRTPKDFPIDARKITHNIRSKNGVYNIDTATDTNGIITAILQTERWKLENSNVKWFLSDDHE